jgi:hypothetical protein
MVSALPSRTPIRRIRYGCCARAATGHAAAPPSTRGGLFDHLVGAGYENRWQVDSRAPWRPRGSMSPRGSRRNVCPQKYKQDSPD